MKSILLSGTAALLLVAASGAYAQDQHQNDNHAGAADNHAGGDQHMTGPAGQTNTGADHGAMGADHGATGADHGATTTHSTTHTTTHRTRHRTTHTTTTTNDNDHNNNGHDNNGADHNTPGDHNNPPPGDHNNNAGAHPHGQLDVSLRVSVNATHHFRGPTWHAPAGYTYRRYSVGARLEPAFYARDYWLTDYASFDLIAPPDGYTWVRFGPDAILIDEDTGEVVRVEYGVFTD